MLITCVFKKQTKKRLNSKTLFKIEFLLMFTVSRKVPEKMPGLVDKPYVENIFLG